MTLRCKDGNHQKKKEMTTGPWVKREKVHRRWDVNRQERKGTWALVVKIGHNGIRDDNRQKRMQWHKGSDDQYLV